MTSGEPAVKSSASDSAWGMVGAGVAVCLRGRGVQACDENFANLVRLRPAQVVGRTLEDLTHPDDVPANVWLLDAARRSGAAFDIRKRYQVEGGALQWVENRVSVVPSPAGDYVLVVSRPIAPPARGSGADPHLREYLADMLGQMAKLAETHTLTDTAQALQLAAVLARREGLP